MTLDNLIELFKTEVTELIRKRAIGNINFKVNLTQGGIAQCDIDISKKGVAKK